MSASVDLTLLKVEAHSPDLSLLSKSEMLRFHAASPVSANVFALGRGLLRKKLGEQLDIDPLHVPLLQEDGGPVTLNHKKHMAFNVSHSGQYVAVAISADLASLGLDIEDMQRRKPNWQGIMRRYFHGSEVDWILGQKNPYKAFYQIWTLKEAITKMDHGAIAHYLKGTEIDMTSNPPALIGQTPKGSHDISLKSYHQDDCMVAVAADCQFSF